MASSETSILVIEKGDLALQLLSKSGERKFHIFHFHTCNQVLNRIFKNHIAAAVIGADLDLLRCVDLVKKIKTHSTDTRIILALQGDPRREILEIINLGIYGLIDIQNSKSTLLPMVISAISDYEDNQRLAMTELKYHKLFDNLREAVIALDSQGKIIECNPSFVNLIGYSQEELQQMTIWKITPPRWHEIEKELFKKVLPSNGSTGLYEKEYICKDGTIIPVDVSAHTIQNSYGLPIGIWELARDIRQRKKREQETTKLQEEIIRQQRALIELSRLTGEDLHDSLHKITEKTAEILNVQRVGIWIFNEDKSLLECVDLFVKSQKQHLSGDKLITNAYPKFFNALSNNRLIAAHDVVNDPSTCELADNYLIPLKISSILDCAIRHHGEVAGVLCHEHIGEPRLWSLEEQNFAASMADTVVLLLETHERLQAEKALRKSEDRYRSIFENSPVAIVEMDFNDILTKAILINEKNGKINLNSYAKKNSDYFLQLFKLANIINLNQAALQLCEADSKQEVIDSLDLIITSEAQLKIKEIFISISQRKESIEGETSIHTIKGKKKDVFYRISLPNKKKQQTNLLITMVDITERNQAEEGLKRKLQEITVLHGIAVAGTESTDIDDLIERTTQLLGETLYSNNFGIFIYDPVNNLVSSHSSYRCLNRKDVDRVEPATKGITGRVIRTGKSQRVADVAKDPDYLEINPNTRSELSVPVVVNDQIYGIINTESTFENAYSEADEKLLITFANQLAIFIEKIILTKEQQRQTREVTALYETALSTSGLLDVEKLLNRIYLQVSDLFPLDTFLVIFKEEETEEISVAMALENNHVLSEWVNQSFSHKDSGCRCVIQNQKSLLFNDLKTEKTPVKPKFVQKPTRSWLGVPLIARGHAIGAISVQCFQPNIYDEHHCHLLETMASQIATALDNARLVEQTQNWLQRLAALHDIDLVINSSLDLRVTLNILLDQVIEKLHVDAAAVMLLNPRTHLLEYSAGRGFRTRNIEKYQLRLGEGLSGQAAMERHLVQALNLSESDKTSAYPELLTEE
ncbi:MAG: GAF domain-containing protein, partial [bacterium]